MADNKRVKLEKSFEALTSRQQAKGAQLDEARQALDAIKQDLADEVSNTKWEAIAAQHNQLIIRIAALVDELQVLAERIRLVRLDLNDYDLAVIHASVTQLVAENTAIRANANALRDEFRRLTSRSSADVEVKQRILDIKTELGQLALAGELTEKELKSLKRQREILTSEREQFTV
jgi:hypothetical protein